MPTQEQIEEYQNKSFPCLSPEDSLRLQEIIQEMREKSPEWIEFKKQCDAGFGIQITESDFEIETPEKSKHKTRWVAPRARRQHDRI